LKDHTRKLLDKAARSIRAASLLVDNGETEFAAGRAYYAMFYAAEAVLYEAGQRSRSHSGVHSLFGEQFAKSGRLDPKFHRWLLDAFDRRLQGDYGFDAAIATEEVDRTIQQAAEFLQAAERLIAAGN
jgi:uncharacterized protein (UPF0332 family)